MKQVILNNQFVDKLRREMKVDEGEYRELCNALISLAETWKNAEYIDKELAGYLYAIPLVVRNEFLSLREVAPKSICCQQLEDIWVELDGLVSDCFTS